MTELSSGEIKLMLKRIDEKIDEHTSVHGDIIDSIEKLHKKVDYTNGKVGELVRWRERVYGMSQVASIVVIPILAWALYQIVTIDDQIAQSVDEIFTIEPYVESNK